MQTDFGIEWIMRQALRFTLALVVGLALLAWGASVLVNRTARAWFERDMVLRSQLAVNSAREALVSRWSAGGAADLGRALAGLARDERVMGAAACGDDLALLARTGDYPTALTCRSLAPRLRTDLAQPGSAGEWSVWASVHAVAVQSDTAARKASSQCRRRWA